MWALIIDNEVVEVTDIDPNGRFHPDLQWIEFDPDQQNIAQRWRYTSGIFSEPEE